MGVQTKSAKLNRNEIKRFKEISFELYNELQLSSHVRFDFRYSDKGIFLIDVNSNPNLAKDDDFALSYSKSYKHLINELVESSFEDALFERENFDRFITNKINKLLKIITIEPNTFS